MLLAAAREARARHHDVAFVFPPSARTRAWLRAFDDERFPVTFAAPSARAGRAQIAELVSTAPAHVVLHSHFSTYDLLVARLALGRPRVKAIWHVHSFLRGSLVDRVRHTAKFALARPALHRVLVVSRDLVHESTRRLAPRRRTVYFPNAIDLERFTLVDETARERARRALGIESQQTVLLHFGWDWDVKRGDVAVAAAGELRRRGNGAVLLTVNPPPEVRRLLAAKEPEARVCEATEDVRSLYAAADVFLSPSRAEGMPFAVLEALASGLPVVASDLPGQREIARSVENCMIADGAPAIADAVERVMSRARASRESAGSRARTWVVEHADVGAWAERLNDVYEAARP
jgi:glycosyltransferase involved in cell wall biosynthesis